MPGIQRIGLSATQRPLERIAQFLVGPKRECEIVDAGRKKKLDLEIVVPVEDMADPGAPAYPSEDGPPPTEVEPSAHVRSIWPAIYPKLVELVQEHTSTIIFVNNRRAAERLAKRMNELANGEGEQELPATEHGGHGDGPSETSAGGGAEGYHPEEALATGRGGRFPAATGPAARSPPAPTSRSPALTMARFPTRSGPWSRRCSSPGSCRASSPPAPWSWGSTWGRSIW